jgi:hypothetical protein
MPKEETQMKELNTKELQELDSKDMQSKGGCCCHGGGYYYGYRYYW